MRYAVGDQVLVREDIEPYCDYEIEVFSINDGVPGGVIDVVTGEFLSKGQCKYVGRTMTICYVDVDEDDGYVWYACEESGGYQGLYDTTWWPVGAFAGLSEPDREVFIPNDKALLGLFGM